MPLSPDIVLDRIRLKRQIKRWRVIAILAVTLLLFFAAGKQAETTLGKPHISHIALEGFIDGGDAQQKLFRNVLEDAHSKALLLTIDSNGGTVVGGEILYNLARRIKKERPVMVVMGNTATSAAYMVAVAADRIFAHKGTVTGAIGVMMESPNVSGLMEKAGVKMDYVRSGPLKGKPSYFEGMTPEAEHMVRSVVDDFFAVFIDIVAEGRGMMRDKALTLADGRVFTGRQAVQNKLVDAIGGKDEALEWLEKEKGIKASLPLKEVESDQREEDLLEWMLSYFPGNLLAKKEFSYHGLLSVW